MRQSLIRGIIYLQSAQVIIYLGYWIQINYLASVVRRWWHIFLGCLFLMEKKEIKMMYCCLNSRLWGNTSIIFIQFFFCDKYLNGCVRSPKASQPLNVNAVLLTCKYMSNIILPLHIQIMKFYSVKLVNGFFYYCDTFDALYSNT